ncbi:MAG: glycoside hydrolase family 2 TIM barrel-domain containing protein [Rikenellaceae bacterium]
MKLRVTLACALFAMLTALTSCCCNTSAVKIDRENDFNFDWKFTLLEDTVTLKKTPLDDSKWRDVRLPHDWSVEASFDESLEGCTGYLPGGVGVYQKHFATPYNKADKSTFVLFDGVYNNAKFWLNGKYLGENPYGYSPTYFDLTEVLNAEGEQNVLTVYVDHSRYADSRWYTGSGIYRNVKLITLDKVHIPIWGTFVTTPEITAEAAKVNIEVSVENQLAEALKVTLQSVIYDGCGCEVATAVGDYSVVGNGVAKVNQVASVKSPRLWDTENPNMYRVVTSLLVDGKKVDEYTTPFGIRSLVFDKDKGFFLNGVETFVKGVCLHHDAGLVGTAVPKGVWRRRFEVLKAGGVNAIRTSHNPFSEEFLDLCDEMGLLVQNEIFDEMDNPKDKRFNFAEQEPLYRTDGYDKHFQEWAESDLKRVLRRDRNHPSVFMYSIGNEIEWTYPEYKHVSGLWDKGAGGYWNATPKLTPAEMKARYDALPPQKYNLAKTSEKLAKWVKEIDTTRPVTSNLIIPVASCVTGYAASLDVVGFSYQIKQYDWCKKHFPEMMFTGNENTGLLSEWRSITDNPMVFSMYMWTGIDYMGESTDDWPQKAWPGDMVDLGGFTKAGWNHFKAIWKDENHLAIQTHVKQKDQYMQKGGKKIKKKPSTNWENYKSEEMWNYTDGEQIVVEVVTNLAEAELLLNGKSLGSKKLADNQDDLIMRWTVPYVAGELVAKGVDKSGKMVVTKLSSATEPAKLVVDVDKSQLAADGYDVAHLVAQVVDKSGVAVKHLEKRITFKVEGKANLLGVDNGWNKSTQDYQSDNVETRLGRCLAIIQSERGVAETVSVTVSAEGLAPVTVQIAVK